MIERLLHFLDEFAQRLNTQPHSFYAKFDVRAPASSAEINRFRDHFGDRAVDDLISLWASAGGIEFEWFLNMAGAQSAGIDSRVAPSGQLHLLTPDDVIKEAIFLEDLAGVTDDSLPLIPFAKLKPNGEVLALDTSVNGGAVVLVFLDLILSVVPLADSLDAWLKQRLTVYFEDSSLIPDGEINPVAKSVLDAVSARTLIWPPKGNRLR